MMRTLLRSTALLAVLVSPALAQEGAHPSGGGNLLSPNAGLMFWTLAVFVIFFLVFRRYFYPLLTDMVIARENALRDALDAAKRDRAEAERVLGEHKAQLEAGRTEAQKLIADGRAVAEKMRTQVLDETKKQQDELLARAKRDIEAEKVGAIAALRREAIDLALKGASKVIEKNLDDATNRKLVEEFLATVGKT
jgi:F-type H+-transporting ATPase subunit b